MWVEEDPRGRRVRVGYDGTLKLVRSADADAVYDLAADPAESRRLDGGGGRRGSEARWTRSAPSRAPRTSPARPRSIPSARRAPGALGYVE